MTLRTKIELAAAGVVLVIWQVQGAAARAKAAAERRAAETRIAAEAKQQGFAEGKKASQPQIAATLPPKLAVSIAAIKKAEPTAAVVAHESTTVTISDTAKGTATSEGGRMTSVEDEYGRFHFDLTGAVPILTRKQFFKFDGVVVKRLGGKHEFYKAEFREYVPGKEPSPATEIPTEGIIAKSEFQFLEEQAPEPGLFHPIIVAAADSAGIGAGVEFFHYKRFSLSALGLYDKSAKAVRGSLQLGYRLQFPWLDTNLTVGGSYSTDRQIRPSGSIQITR